MFEIYPDVFFSSRRFSFFFSNFFLDLPSYGILVLSIRLALDMSQAKFDEVLSLNSHLRVRKLKEVI